MHNFEINPYFAFAIAIGLSIGLLYLGYSTYKTTKALTK